MNEKQLKEMLHRFDRVPLPDKDTLLSACDSAFDERQAKPLPSCTTVKKPRRLLRILIAACISLSAFTLCVAAAEQYEYHTALNFFEKYELSTEGCSRRDIKKVWRDITSGKFTYGKTAEVIAEYVGVNTLTIEALTPEQLEALWDKKTAEEQAKVEEFLNSGQGFVTYGTVSPAGISFRYQVEIRQAETVDETYTTLEKYTDGKLTWRRKLPSISTDEIAYSDTYIALRATTQTEHALILLSQEGEELWRRSFTSYDSDCGGIFLDDHHVSVISNLSHNTLQLLEYDFDGTLRYRCTNKYAQGDGVSFENASRALKLGENYLLQAETSEGDTAFLRLNRALEIQDHFVFYTPHKAYRIMDVATCGSDLYVSCYVLPEEYGNELENHKELESFKRQLLALNGEPSEEDVMNYLKEYYTAVIYRINTQTGATETYHQVSGALGDTFSVDAEGNLIWRVKSIASVKYEVVNGDPLYEGFAPCHLQFDAVCGMYEYIFDASGTVIDQRLTDDIAVIG